MRLNIRGQGPEPSVRAVALSVSDARRLACDQQGQVRATGGPPLKRPDTDFCSALAYTQTPSTFCLFWLKEKYLWLLWLYHAHMNTCHF